MKRFSNILFVTESGVDDSAAFGQALALAINNQAQITVVGTVDVPDTKRAKTLRDAMIEEQREQLQALMQSASSSKTDIEAKVLVGKAFVEIIREVLRNGRDLIIKSVDRTGSRLFGGTDMKLLRKCPCPLWIIQSTQQKGYREILVALDYEPENPENEALNRQLLEMASSLALSEFSELHVVHAWRLEEESYFRSPRFGLSNAEVDEMVEEEERRRRDWLTRVVEECYAAQGTEVLDYLKPQLHLVKGDAPNVVPECATALGAELVVMGTVGRTGIPGFFIGSTAEEILSKIDCSILAIKPAGFISPVTADVGG